MKDNVTVPTTLQEYCVTAQPQRSHESSVAMDDFYDDDYMDDEDEDDQSDDDTAYRDNDDDSGNGESWWLSFTTIQLRFLMTKCYL